MVCPFVNVAVAVADEFAVWSFHVQLLPSVVVPETLSLCETVRSGAVTETLSEQALLASLVSGTRPSGSTAHEPPARGFANVPVADGVALNETVNDAPESI